MEITADYLRELLHYNPQTGIFVWKVSIGRRGRVGDVAGRKKTVNGSYNEIGIHGTRFIAHRLAYLYMVGEWPEFDVDHKDGDTWNNKWTNLRHATKSQNIANSKLRVDNTSGIKGVYFHKERKKWVAYMYVNHVQINLGGFHSIEDAEKARRRAFELEYGEFARHA